MIANLKSQRKWVSIVGCAVLFSCSDDDNRHENGHGSDAGKRSLRSPASAGRASDSADRNAFFRKALELHSASELEEAWNFLKEEDLPRNERLLLERRIIEQLTLLGNFDDAKRLALTYGEGSNRTAMIFALFSRNPSPLADMMRMATDGSLPPDGIHAAYNGIARNVAQPDGLSKVSDLINSGHRLSAAEATAISKGLGARANLDEGGLTSHIDASFNRIGRTDSELQANFAEVDGVLQALIRASPGSRDAAIDIFVGMTIRTMPFEAWGTLMRNYDSMSDEVRAKRAEGLAEVMFVRSPERALSELASLRERADISHLYGSGFDAWLDSDKNAAASWFATNKASLTQREIDHIAATSGTHYIEASRVADAWKWVGEIQDPVMRRKAEGEVWAAERNAVRQNVDKNPEATVQAMVSGESQHQTYWIEEAMMTWIAKEPENAEEWYQANWKSLPPAKSQYVAAAYAKNALGLGDTATARQWSNLIQDPKTRERIEASITKAEAGGGGR